MGGWTIKHLLSVVSSSGCPHHASTVTRLQSAKGLQGRKKDRVVLCTKKSPNSIYGMCIYWYDRIPVAFVFSMGQGLDEMMFRGLIQPKPFSDPMTGKCLLEGNICSSEMCSNIYIKISIMFSNLLLNDRAIQLY